jgi:pectin methylesterase-like acyl-CoA thioesterase
LWFSSLLFSYIVTQTVATTATIYVPDDYPAIQATVDAATSGDTIIVRDGTYVENVDVNKLLFSRGEKSK